MTHSGDPPPRKGSQWLVEKIVGGAEAPAGGPAPSARRLSHSEIDDLVAWTLEEELRRLKGERDGD